MPITLPKPQLSKTSRSGAGRSVVGLDIEPGYVTAVEAQPANLAVERAAAAPLAPGVVRDGEIADVDALAEVLRGFFREHGFGRRVRLGVANQRIVVRTVDLPPLEDRKELAAAVSFHAQEHIPMPLEQAVLDFQSMGIVDTPDGPRTRVVLVAARRDMIERLLTAARRAGLRPSGIDLSAFAMVRALQLTGDVASADAGAGGEADGGQPAQTGQATLYVCVGGMTNLALADGPRCVFTRVVAGGTETMVQELAERRGLTLEHAHQWLVHVGLVTPVDEVEGDPAIVSEARTVLGDGVRRIGDEVRNSLDYYRMQEGAIVVGDAVLTGPAAAIDGFADGLGHQVSLPVRLGLVAEARPGALGGIDAGRLAVATGLTVEERAA